MLLAKPLCYQLTLYAYRKHRATLDQAGRLDLEFQMFALLVPVISIKV
jgi:hypothetical protein